MSSFIVTYHDSNTYLKTDNIHLTGTNSFGNMLVDEYLANQGDVGVDNGCNIFSLKISGNIASVSFETSQDCSLLVAIYDNETDDMLASGVIDVTTEEKQKNVAIKTDNMPQYYYTCAYLIETDTLAPLCIAFKDTSHTKEMQEFLSKTTDDFGTKKILNFDNDQNNNFAVYNNDVYVFKETETSNIVTSVDYENDIYSFKDIEKTGFEKDDIIAVESLENGLVILKVDYIISESEGAYSDYYTNSLKIKSQEFDIEEVFEYVKIDSTKSTIQNSSTYSLARSSVPSPLNAPNEFSGTINPKIELNTFGISGSVEGKLKPSIKFYFSNSVIPKYFEVMVDAEFSVEIGSEQAFELPEFELGEFNIGAYGFNIGGDISIEIGAKGKISTEFTFGTNFGVIYDADSSPAVRFVTPKPDLNIQIKSEITPYFMVSIKPNANFIKEDVASVGIAFKAGIEVKSELVIWEMNKNDSIQHACDHCIDGDIKLVKKISAEIKICKKKIPLQQNVIISSDKLQDFYYSVSFDEFGWGTCPYIKYKVSVQVNDELGNPADDTEIICENNVLAKTDKNGKAEIWLKDGKYTLMAKKGELSSGKNIIVHSPKRNIVMTLGFDDNYLGNAKAKKLSLGRWHSGYIGEDNSLYVWGSSLNGRLGNNSTDDDYIIPTKILDNISNISFGEEHSGVVARNGTLYMWGRNNYGQVGNGTNDDVLTPTPVLENVKQVFLKDFRSAALTNNNELYVWGWNLNGEVGNGTTTHIQTPVKIMDNVKEVILGEDITAAITTDDSLYLWGNNEYGQLGNGSYDFHVTSPVKIMENVEQFAYSDSEIIGGPHSTAITTDGSLYTWGDNVSGELGDGNIALKSNTPNKIMDDVQKVVLQYEYSAAITEDNSLYMWGDNTFGQLGTGDKTDVDIPTKIMDDIEDVILISNCTTVAVTTDGTMYAIGSNYNGIFGNGSQYNSSLSPVKVMENIETIEISATHQIALTQNGELYSWGQNFGGQLGIGNEELTLTPTKISFPSNINLRGSTPRVLSDESGFGFSNPYTQGDNFICNVYRIINSNNEGCSIGKYRIKSVYQTVKYSDAPPTFDSNLYEYTMTVPMKSTLIGDANNDGTFNVSDAVMLQKWLLGSSELTCWKNVDLCMDNEIDVFDLCQLKRLLVENS